MKRSIAILFSAITVLTARAQVSDGYCRVQNTGTGRYITVVDDKGKLNYATTEADMGALRTFRSFTNIVGNPGSIIYLRHIEGDSYNLEAQGTDVMSIIGHYVRLKDNGDGTYKCFQEKGGTRQYINDTYGSQEWGDVKSNDKTLRDWRIRYLDSQSDSCYFGLKAPIEAEGKHYCTTFGSFGMKPAAGSTATRALIVTKVAYGVAVYREAEFPLPASTPVIFECSSPEYDTNRIDVSRNDTPAPADNLLRGVYFHFTKKTHYNVVDYDPQTMRVLGVCADGKPGFVKSGLTYIEANTAYLQVPAGTADELPLVSEDEFASGISEVGAEPNVATAVYNLAGQRVAASANDLTRLPAGIYVVGGRKVSVSSRMQ